MLRRKVFALLIALIVLSSFFAFEVKLSNAITITVPDEYGSIQSAVNAANTGDTVSVRSGTYYEHIIITKTISLIGENKTTTIDGNGTGTVITILASNVKITGFTIRNPNAAGTADGIRLISTKPTYWNPIIINKANITGNIFVDLQKSLQIDRSSEDNYIFDNKFQNVSYGISVNSAKNRILKNSIMYSKETAIALGSYTSFAGNNSIMDNYLTFSDTGISLMGSNFIVKNNTIQNSDLGILLEAENSILDGNTVTNNGMGIWLIAGGSDRFYNNQILSNSWGFEFFHVPGRGNVFRNNTMLNNTDVNFGFAQTPDQLAGYMQDIDTSNTINGKPIYYAVNKTNLIVPEGDQFAFVAVVNSTNVVVNNLNISGNSQGTFGNAYFNFISAYMTNSTIGKIVTNRSFFIGVNDSIVENNSGYMRFRNSNNNLITNMNGASLDFQFSNSNRFVNDTSTSIDLFVSNRNVVEGNNHSSVNIAYSGDPLGDDFRQSSGNTVTNNNLTGVSILWSSDNIVSNNTLTGPYAEDKRNDRSYGILLEGAANNTFTNNMIRGFAQGITTMYGFSDKSYSFNNTFVENTIVNNTVGLILAGYDNVFEGNTFYSNRFNIYGQGLIHNQFDFTNTVNGKLVYLIVNQSDIIINPLTYPYIGYLGLVNSENVTINNLTLSNNVEGILLYNTTNITLINCTIKENGVGVQVTGSFNRIINSTISENLHGITLGGQGHDLVSGNTIINNTFFNLDPQNPYFKQGYGLYNWSPIVPYGTSGGLFINSGNNTIISNTIEDNLRGIILYGGNNTFRDNELAGNTLNFAVNRYGRISILTQDMDPSNTVDGKPIYYWVNQTGKTVPEDAGFVALINSTDITVKNLNLSGNEIGIYLAGVRNIMITNTTITNSVFGIHLTSTTTNNNEPLSTSEDNTIANCTITGTTSAISLWPWGANYTLIRNNVLSNNIIGIWIGTHSFYNVIEGNLITNSTLPEFSPYPENEGPEAWMTFLDEGAIVLESSFNTVRDNTIAYSDVGLSVGSPALGSPGENLIYHNNFINNTNQVQIGSLNFWNNGYPDGGNYFSDYNGTDLYRGQSQNQSGSDGIGDTPYNLVDASDWYRIRIDPQKIEAIRWAGYPLMHPWSSLPVHNMNDGLGYSTIQGAIDANETTNGDTIFVEQGTYHEHVNVNKSISLIGENRLTTIIDGNQTGTVVTVPANSTEISRFTIQNGGKQPWENAGASIQVLGNYSVISDNILRNSTFGLEIESGGFANVTFNRIEDNYRGISLLFSQGNNTITANTIDRNVLYGIEIIYSLNSNTIFHNNFVGNNQSVYTTGSIDKWENGKEGNYWSDYNGTDLNHDGIGDTPYIIDSNNRDNHPLMNQYPAGDLNHDGVINTTDVNILIMAWGAKKGEPNYNALADFNGSGRIDSSDVAIMGANWKKHV